MNIFLQAFVWQFFDVPKEILKAWKNFLLFGLNYFSIPTLLRTYFSYWRKYHSSYGNALEVWKNFETFVFNSMSRIIGVILRTFFVIFGVILEITIFIIGLIVFVAWIILPALLLFGFLAGIKFLL